MMSQRRSENCRNGLPSSEDLVNRMKKLIKRQMCDLISELEVLGEQTIVVMTNVYSRSFDRYGSSTGEKFLNTETGGQGLEIRFHSYCMDRHVCFCCGRTFPSNTEAIEHSSSCHSEVLLLYQNNKTNSKSQVTVKDKHDVWPLHGDRETEASRMVSSDADVENRNREEVIYDESDKIAVESRLQVDMESDVINQTRGSECTEGHLYNHRDNQTETAGDQPGYNDSPLESVQERFTQNVNMSDSERNLETPLQYRDNSGEQNNSIRKCNIFQRKLNAYVNKKPDSHSPVSECVLMQEKVVKENFSKTSYIGGYEKMIQEAIKGFEEDSDVECVSNWDSGDTCASKNQSTHPAPVLPDENSENLLRQYDQHRLKCTDSSPDKNMVESAVVGKDPVYCSRLQEHSIVREDQTEGDEEVSRILEVTDIKKEPSSDSSLAQLEHLMTSFGGSLSQISDKHWVNTGTDKKLFDRHSYLHYGHDSHIMNGSIATQTHLNRTEHKTSDSEAGLHLRGSENALSNTSMPMNLMKTCKRSSVPPVDIAIATASIATDVNKLGTYRGRTVQCRLCNKVFGTPSLYKYHLREHDEIRPYVCLVCKKCFKDKETHKRHVRTHSGEKPYSCNICHQRFNHTGSLSNHKKRHRLKEFRHQQK